MISVSYRFCLLCLWLAGTGVASAQRLDFDLKAGVPLTNQTRCCNDESRRYIIGGGVEARLWRGFAVEGNFLYRRLGQHSAVRYNLQEQPGVESPVEVSNDTRARFDVIEVPILGKYYFRHDKKISPFISTGYSFRKIRETNEYAAELRYATGRVENPEGKSTRWGQLDIGAVVGLGLQWRVGRISLVPEFRYTRWGGQPAGPGYKQQVDFLLGIRF